MGSYFANECVINQLGGHQNKLILVLVTEDYLTVTLINIIFNLRLKERYKYRMSHTRSKNSNVACSVKFEVRGCSSYIKTFLMKSDVSYVSYVHAYGI